MLIVLFGITGAGKSYFTNLIAEKYNFKRIIILTTREKRINETSGVDKIFISDEELAKMIDNSQIGYYFDYLGVRYAYLKNDLENNDKKIVEMHYTEISKLKELYPNAITIYIKPVDKNTAKKYLKERKLNPLIEADRITEMDEEYAYFNNNIDLQRKFDYILLNNYDENSANDLLVLIERLINEK